LYAEAKSRLEVLNKKDAERRKTAELKNNLESYIYSMKEKVIFSSCPVFIVYTLQSECKDIFVACCDVNIDLSHFALSLDLRKLYDDCCFSIRYTNLSMFVAYCTVH
jgi:hypothetical protein